MNPPPHHHLLLRAAATTALLGLAATPPTADAFEFNAILWAQAHAPIALELHETTVSDLTLAELEAATRRAAATWNAVPCAWIALDYVGTTPDRLDPPLQDDRQLLEFVSEEARWTYGSMTAGITINTTPADAPEQPQVDVAFNGVDFAWVEGGAGALRLDVLDPQTVITHELGHLLGLAHTDASNAATMAAGYLPDLGQRTLAFDDKAGLCARYWAPGDECDADCPDGSACDTFTHPDTSDTARLCAEPHGAWGDPCDGDNLWCEGTCVFTAAGARDGFCSTLCDPNAPDCPADWSCQNVQTAADPLTLCLPDERGGEEVDAGDVGSGADGGSNAPSGDGCGCRSMPRRGRAGWVVCLVAVGWVWRRRRRGVTSTAGAGAAAACGPAPRRSGG